MSQSSTHCFDSCALVVCVRSCTHTIFLASQKSRVWNWRAKPNRRTTTTSPNDNERVDGSILLFSSSSSTNSVIVINCHVSVQRTGESVPHNSMFRPHTPTSHPQQQTQRDKDTGIKWNGEWKEKWRERQDSIL